MSYTYAQKKNRQVPPAHTPEAQGPSLESLKQGLAPPSAAQLGHPVDLPGAIRSKMEASFGADLSAVRLYESQAVADAGADAVTQGSRVAFAPGMLDFTSRSGQALLGHELSHVVSQARGEVTGGGFLNDHALEARADREGAMAAAGETVYAGPVTAPLSAASAAPAAGPMQASKAEKRRQRKQEYFQSNLDALGTMQTATDSGASRWAPFRAGRAVGNDTYNTMQMNNYQAMAGTTAPNTNELTRARERAVQNLTQKGQFEAGSDRTGDSQALFLHAMRMGRLADQQLGKPLTGKAADDKALENLNRYGYYRFAALMDGSGGTIQDARSPDQGQNVMGLTAREMADYMHAMKGKYGLNLHNYGVNQLYQSGDKSNRYGKMMLDLGESAAIQNFLQTHQDAYDPQDAYMQEALALSSYYQGAMNISSARVNDFLANSETEHDPFAGNDSRDAGGGVSRAQFEQSIEALQGFNSSRKQRKLFQRKHL